MRRALNRRSLPLLVVVALAGGGLASAIAGAIDSGPPAVEQPAATDADDRGDRGSDAAGEGRLAPGASERDTYLTEPAAGEAAGAGPDPATVARRFGELWSNRAGERAALGAQRREIVGLARAAWARELDREYAEAIEAGGEPTTTEGSIVAVERAPAEGRGASRGYLIIARERLLRGGQPLEPYRYATYLARLERRGGLWAVSAWEPQL